MNEHRQALPLLPSGFRFGASTAAYQIEGAATEDGRGQTVWDTFASIPGRVIDGSSGSVACDHYHRWAEDLDLLAAAGMTGYRFSVAWSRIQPTGRDQFNQAGLDFYDRLIDGLLERGIDPMLTIYHWDLPQALQDDGGWLNRETVERFGDYAAILGDAFADRVTHWVPVNEPNVHMMLGHAVGEHAPGLSLGFDSLIVGHHLLLAHGRACVALRAEGARAIGCANNHAPIWPASDDEADTGASKLFDQLYNGFFLEPMLLGRYPADVAPFMEDLSGDLVDIRQPLDFYGINYYNPMRIAATEEGAELPFEQVDVVGYPTTGFGWPVVPDSLRDMLINLRARYRAAMPPIYITEGGCSYADETAESGEVHDADRIDYLSEHIWAVAEAVNRGVDVRGYYCWSLMDNWEWAEGFTQRFGLVHIDFETLKRTPKASYQWYADLIRAQPPRGA